MKISLQKKILFLGLPTLVILLALFLLQGPIFKVSAQIVPVTVGMENLSFGTVFPGEELEGNFIVTYADTGDGIGYRIIQKRKPLPPEHPEYPNGGDPEMPGYYRSGRWFWGSQKDSNGSLNLHWSLGLTCCYSNNGHQTERNRKCGSESY